MPAAGSAPKPERPIKDAPPEGKYPLTTRYTTTGGHVVNIVNEKDKESISIFHAKGTNIQIYPDGMISIYTPGEYRQHSKSSTISVEGNTDEFIDGHEVKNVTGGTRVTIAGDAHLTVGGTTTMNCIGDFALKAKNIYMGADNNFNMAALGNLNMESKGNMEISSIGQMKQTSQGAMTSSTRSTMIVESASAMTIGSAAGITEQAPRIDLNPGGGASGDAANPVKAVATFPSSAQARSV